MTLATTFDATFDPTQFRRRFPALADRVHLSSCSGGGPPSPELAAAYQHAENAINEQGLAWPEWEQEVATSRELYAGFVGATSSQIAIMPDATTAAFQAVSTINWTRTPRLVTSYWEFSSLGHLWHRQELRGAEVIFAGPEPANGLISSEDLAAEYVTAIDDRTGLVSIPLAYYRTGARLPIKPIVDRARQVGALVLIDAYQGIGVIPIDVKELDCDFLVAGSFKYLLGRPGIAFLYVRDPAAGLAPLLTGWHGRVDKFAFDPKTVDFPSTATRFEIGTPPVHAAYLANAGVRILNAQQPLSCLWAHVRTLVQQAHEQLTAQGEQLANPADDSHGAIVAIRDENPQQLERAIFRSHQVSTSARGDVVRAAFHGFNNADDVTQLCHAIAAYRRTDPMNTATYAGSGQISETLSGSRYVGRSTG